jgi:hypothetical protein
MRPILLLIKQNFMNLSIFVANDEHAEKYASYVYDPSK